MASNFTYVENYFAGSDPALIGATLASCFVLFTVIFTVHKFMLNDSTCNDAVGFVSLRSIFSNDFL